MLLSCLFENQFGIAMSTTQPDEHLLGHEHSHPEIKSADSVAMLDSSALKDPVCGMNVTEKSLHRSEHMNRTFYFCGPKCKARFDASPMQYLGKQAENVPAC
jgi:Cu+-exporting ATPase